MNPDFQAYPVAWCEEFGNPEGPDGDGNRRSHFTLAMSSRRRPHLMLSSPSPAAEWMHSAPSHRPG